MSKVKCECEHIAHFEADKRTPNGQVGHHYGDEFPPEFVGKVNTPMGEFTVCFACATDCYDKYVEVVPVMLAAGDFDHLAATLHAEQREAAIKMLNHWLGAETAAHYAKEAQLPSAPKVQAHADSLREETLHLMGVL